MTPIEIAKYYFDLSNESNFALIQSLLTQSTTYRSGNGELFLGIADIMLMQRNYHGCFSKLHWQVNKVDQAKPAIIAIEFDFIGENHAGDILEYSGLESIIIYESKVQHIDVFRK